MPPSEPNSSAWRRWAALWLLLGLALRIACILHPRAGDDDTDAYFTLGTNLFHHFTYGFIDDGVASPALFRLPGYPIFLALFAGNFTLVCIAQSLIDLAGCLMLGLFLRRYLGPRAGLTALALSATCFFTADYAATPLTESLSLFATAAAIYTLGELLASDSRVPHLKQPHRLRWGAEPSRVPHLKQPHRLRWGSLADWRHLVPLASTAALAMLLRPDGALLTASIALTLLVYGFKQSSAIPALRTTILFGLLACIPLIPWTIRNAVTFHVFQPLAPRHVNDPGERVNFGFYRWLRTWSVDFETTGNVFWKVGSEPIDMANLPPRAFDSDAQRAETAALIAAYNLKHDVDQPLDDRFAVLAETRVRTHPFRYYLWVPALRILDNWLRPRTEGLPIANDWWNWHDHPRESALAIALGLLNLFYVAAAISGAFRRPPVAVFLFTYFALRCLLLSTLENPEPRYALEAYPILLTLAAIALTPRQSKHLPREASA